MGPPALRQAVPPFRRGRAPGRARGAGVPAASNAARRTTGRARAASRRRCVSRRGRDSPRSRSWIPRTDSPARAARAAWVSPAPSRSCRRRTPNGAGERSAPFPAAPPPSLSGCCRPDAAVPATSAPRTPGFPLSRRRPPLRTGGRRGLLWEPAAPRRQPRVAPGRARDGPRHYPRRRAAWVGPRNCAVTRRPSTQAGAAAGGRPATRMRRSPAWALPSPRCRCGLGA